MVYLKDRLRNLPERETYLFNNPENLRTGPMIKVEICGQEHECDDSIEQWINDRRREVENDGDKFWFVVDVNNGDDISIKMPSDNSPFGKDTPYGEFSPSEQRLIDLWNELGAGQEDSLENLFEFLGRIKGEVG